MKKLVIVFRHSPHGTPSSREGLDLALLSASFEQLVTLIFIDDGVLNLVKDQQPELIGCKDYIATFKALPLYDIDNVFVCQQALAKFGLTTNNLLINADLITPTGIREQFSFADEVLVF